MYNAYFVQIHTFSVLLISLTLSCLPQNAGFAAYFSDRSRKENYRKEKYEPMTFHFHYTSLLTLMLLVAKLANTK